MNTTVKYLHKSRRAAGAHAITGGYACPKCDTRTSVLDSRQDIDGSVRRRRACTSCKLRFTTQEVVIKADIAKYENQRLRLFNRIWPGLEKIADLIDELKAEHG